MLGGVIEVGMKNSFKMKLLYKRMKEINYSSRPFDCNIRIKILLKLSNYFFKYKLGNLRSFDVSMYFGKVYYIYICFTCEHK